MVASFLWQGSIYDFFCFIFYLGLKRPGLHLDIVTDEAFYSPSALEHKENCSIAGTKQGRDYLLSVTLRYVHSYSSCHPVYQCPLVKDMLWVHTCIDFAYFFTENKSKCISDSDCSIFGPSLSPSSFFFLFLFCLPFHFFSMCSLFTSNSSPPLSY